MLKNDLTCDVRCPSSKFGGNLLIDFCVILLTNPQANSLAEVEFSEDVVSINKVQHHDKTGVNKLLVYKDSMS